MYIFFQSRNFFHTNTRIIPCFGNIFFLINMASVISLFLNFHNLLIKDFVANFEGQNQTQTYNILSWIHTILRVKWGKIRKRVTSFFSRTHIYIYIFFHQDCAVLSFPYIELLVQGKIWKDEGKRITVIFYSLPISRLYCLFKGDSDKHVSIFGLKKVQLDMYF